MYKRRKLYSHMFISTSQNEHRAWYLQTGTCNYTYTFRLHHPHSCQKTILRSSPNIKMVHKDCHFSFLPNILGRKKRVKEHWMLHTEHMHFECDTWFSSVCAKQIQLELLLLKSSNSSNRKCNTSEFQANNRKNRKSK